jgi:hypothetical protein
MALYKAVQASVPALRRRAKKIKFVMELCAPYFDFVPDFLNFRLDFVTLCPNIPFSAVPTTKSQQQQLV